MKKSKLLYIIALSLFLIVILISDLSLKKWYIPTPIVWICIGGSVILCIICCCLEMKDK